MEHISVSIADQVFEKLELDILSGVYARGEILTETKLCEALGVSRTPVREALRRLAQEHILEIGSKGIVVIGISKKDIEDIYEIRARIEGMAAARAAVSASDTDLAELNRILELQEFYVAKQDPDQIQNMDSDFHALLYRLCGSAPLCDTLTELHKKVLKYRRASVSQSERATQSVLEHKKIYHAIAAHNEAAAEEAATAHIYAVKSRLTEAE